MNLIPSDRISSSLACITCIPLNGINTFTITTFNNAYMILGSVSIPVKDNEIARTWLIRMFLPLPMRLVAVHISINACRLWNNTRFDISTLITAPLYEAGTPLHSILEAIPGPELFTTFVANLLCGSLRNLGISNPIAIAVIVIIYIFLPKSR